MDRAVELQADVVTFPELALTGYPPEDLLLTAIVGFVDRKDDIFNAAAIVQGGRVALVFDGDGRDRIPRATIEKPPSAELRPDQKDSDSLPPYDVLDPILKMYVEEDRSLADIVSRGFDEKIAQRVAAPC